MNSIVGQHQPRDFSSGKVACKVRLRVLVKFVLHSPTDNHADYHEHDGNYNYPSHHHSLIVLVFLSKINNSTIPQALRQHGITVKTAKPVGKFTGLQSLNYT